MNFYNSPAIVSQAMNTNFVSPAFQVFDQIAYAFQSEFTGSSISGSLKLQGSCDPYNVTYGNSTNPNVTNWSDISGSQITLNAAGNFLYTVSFPGYNYVRLVYTDNSGGTSNGIFNARFNTK